MERDYFMPRNPSAFAAWHDNYTTQIQLLAAKYNFSNGQIEQILNDNAWIQYWAQAKLQVENQKQQVNGYWKVINSEPEAPMPATPVLTLPPNLPRDIPPGLRKRRMDERSFIKGNKTVYSDADGELLGLEGAQVSRPNDPKPEFELQTLANFALEASFRRYEFDSVRFEYQFKGETAWHLATILRTSPGVFNITPQTDGTPQQVSFRAVFLKNDKPAGVFSDIKTALIAP